MSGGAGLESPRWALCPGETRWRRRGPGAPGDPPERV